MRNRAANLARRVASGLQLQRIVKNTRQVVRARRRMHLARAAGRGLLGREEGIGAWRGRAVVHVVGVTGVEGWRKRDVRGEGVLVGHDGLCFGRRSRERGLRRARGSGRLWVDGGRRARRRRRKRGGERALRVLKWSLRLARKELSLTTAGLMYVVCRAAGAAELGADCRPGMGSTHALATRARARCQRSSSKHPSPCAVSSRTVPRTPKHLARDVYSSHVAKNGGPCVLRATCESELKLQSQSRCPA